MPETRPTAAPRRLMLALALSVMVTSSAYAGNAGAPIVIIMPAVQPGDACIPSGVGSGNETSTSKGVAVIATRIHGAHATRCPDPQFPNLASTDKLPSDEERKRPSSHCVARQTKVGDELMIPDYGQATVLALDGVADTCRNGVMVKVISSVAHRAARGIDPATPITVATQIAVREPSDQEIQSEYDRLVAATQPVQEYLVRHILLRTRGEALAALARIKAGQGFGEVAGALSTDRGSKDKGGDLGWAVPSFFIDEFSKGMVALAPSGLSSEPVQTKFGWHIIEVLQTKVGRDSFPPLSAMRTHIASRLMQLQRVTNAAAAVPVKAVCRNMVPPTLPAGYSATGAKAVVVARVRIENGRVVDVLGLSGPAELHQSVTDALNRYECDRLDRPVTAVQTFEL